MASTYAANEGTQATAGVRLKIDFLDASYATGLGGIAVVGAHGMGWYAQTGRRRMAFTRIRRYVDDDDFTTLGLYSGLPSFSRRFYG